MTEDRAIFVIDYLRRWVPEKDYSTYPKEKWCDYDIVANYIIQQNYIPKTTIENLVRNIIAHFECETEDGNSEFFPTYNDDLMINIDGVTRYIEASGGLEEFDYWC